jgi:hypothetical protein
MAAWITLESLRATPSGFGFAEIEVNPAAHRGAR